MTAEDKSILEWAAAHQFTATEVDCFTTVMLKILDGKCKMSAPGKQVMELLYDVVKTLPGNMLTEADHALIVQARAMAEPDDQMRMLIYERRLLAETMISRPVMKAFKASLREEGILGSGVSM